MKKTISLLLCLVLLVSMAATLTACSKTTIVGSWTTTVDCTEKVRAILLEGYEAMEQFFDLPKFTVKLNVQFSDDSTFVVLVDEGELSNSLSTLDEPLRTGIKKYFNNMGLDTQTLESMGASVDSALAVFHDKNVGGALVNAFMLNGTYKLEENTIYLNDHPTNLPDGSMKATVELSKSELVLKDANVSFETATDLAAAINAGLTFTRVED